MRYVTWKLELVSDILWMIVRPMLVSISPDFSSNISNIELVNTETRRSYWQEMQTTSTHLFKVCCNDHSVSCFPLMYHYGVLSISYKMLIIAGISNDKTNELTIYEILCRNVTIFYRQKLASLFQVQEKMKACRNWKWNFSSGCFIADDRHVKVVWLYGYACMAILYGCSSFHRTWYITFLR